MKMEDSRPSEQARLSLPTSLVDDQDGRMNSARSDVANAVAEAQSAQRSLTTSLKSAMRGLQASHELVSEVLSKQINLISCAQDELAQLKGQCAPLGQAASLRQQSTNNGMHILPPTLLGAVPDEEEERETKEGAALAGTASAVAPSGDQAQTESKSSRMVLLRDDEEVRARSFERRKPSPPRGRSSLVAQATRAKNQILARQKTANLFVDEEDLKAKVRAAIGEPEYDVATFYKTSGCCQKLARSKYFENLTLFLIVVNAIWLAIDTDFNVPTAPTDTVFVVAEHFFCAFFLCEWLLRFAAFQRTRDCIKDFWLVFDGFLMGATVVETWMLQFILWAAGVGQGRLESTGMIRIVRLMRIVRIARIARVLHMVPELLILVKAMVVAMRAVFFSVTLLVLVLYVFGIVFTQLARDVPSAEVHFGTVPDAMTTLLLNGIFLDSVAEVVRDVGKENLFFSALFMAFILVATLTVMNMLVGILVEVISVIASVEKEHLLIATVQKKLEEVMHLHGLDQDTRLTRWEFLKLIQQPEAARILQDVGVDAVGLFDFIGVIFPNPHATLTFPALMQVVLSLRGNNLATVKDLVDLRKCLLGELSRLAPLEPAPTSPRYRDFQGIAAGS